MLSSHGRGSSRGRGRLRGFLELRRPWGFSPEARRGSQGASRAAPGKSGLHAHAPALSGRLPGLPGIPQDVAGLTRKFETSAVGGPTCRKTPIYSRSLSGGGGKPSCPSPSAGDLRELPRVPPIPPSIRVFSNESTLHMRWPKYWSFSFSISHSNEHPGQISFRIDRKSTEKSRQHGCLSLGFNLWAAQHFTRNC